MALIDDLITRRNAIGVELAALSTTQAGGLPNESGAGTSIDHVGYKDGLYRELAEITSLISQLDSDGAWEVTSEATV